MSIPFSQTSSPYRGLVQFYEKELGMNYGDVSGNSERLGEFTSRANLALDKYLLLWARHAGDFEADDTNHSDFQIITTNIVSGQRDYSFTTDGNSNRINTVYKVLILPSATATDYVEIDAIDEMNTSISDILSNTRTGSPIQYGKMANAILLDSIPGYNATNGLKMVVGREGSYFTTSDTTKVPGVPVYHEYFYLQPAFEVASIRNLASLPNLEKKVADLEGSERSGVVGRIAKYFGQREKDKRHIMRPKKISFI